MCLGCLEWVKMCAKGPFGKLGAGSSKISGLWGRAAAYRSGFYGVGKARRSETVKKPIVPRTSSSECSGKSTIVAQLVWGFLGKTTSGVFATGLFCLYKITKKKIRQR